MKTQKTTHASERIVEKVRERYGKFAEDGTSCCGDSQGCADDTAAGQSSAVGYSDVELSSASSEANLGLGCGAPIGLLELRPGETVLDLGSGGGLDAFLAARQVGSQGRVYGVDMTPQMIERARSNAARAGYDNVEFREGRLESLPIEPDSIDAITSNCVINLVPDKPAVFREIARVLRPGGRLVISDIVLDGELPPEIVSNVMAYVGCVAGALKRERYFGMVEDAGLADVEVLRDVDFLATTCELPDEVQALLESAKLHAEDLVGKVRSVTFRAHKPRG